MIYLYNFTWKINANTKLVLFPSCISCLVRNSGYSNFLSPYCISSSIIFLPTTMSDISNESFSTLKPQPQTCTNFISDSHPVQITTIRLIGDNFFLWSQSVRMYIRGREEWVTWLVIKKGTLRKGCSGLCNLRCWEFHGYESASYFKRTNIYSRKVYVYKIST